MSRVQIGTERYKYPFVPAPKKVQTGTTPFRGVPFVPGLRRCKQSKDAGKSGKPLSFQRNSMMPANLVPNVHSSDRPP